MQEEEALFKFFDEDLSHTKKLTLTVSTIRRFRNALAKTIEAWDRFAHNEILVFNPIGWEALQPHWDSLLTMTRKEIDELRTLHSLLEQKLELFNNMKDSVSLSDYFVRVSKLTSLDIADGQRLCAEGKRRC